MTETGSDKKSGRQGNSISVEDAWNILKTENESEILDIFRETSRLRLKRFGQKVSCCAILNARCGACPEDCAFCAQSAHARTSVEVYPLVSESKMVASAEAMSGKAAWFSIVTSGTSVEPGTELERICGAVAKIGTDLPFRPCASLGVLSKDSLRRLKDSGLRRYHHNLETAPSFFSSICGTRDFQERLDTVNRAKEVGLEVCSGGIFGMGETLEQRIELLDTLRGLDVDSIPINFLVPVPGTRLENAARLTPLEGLKIIAAARLMMPEKEIRICGGRGTCLRDLHSWVFAAGASGIMIGNYLTTGGCNVEDDLRMIADLGLETDTSQCSGTG